MRRNWMAARDCRPVDAEDSAEKQLGFHHDVVQTRGLGPLSVSGCHYPQQSQIYLSLRGVLL
jgi:hypothetical protein